MLALTPYQFIILLTIIRALWHILTPVGIAGDESYYWMWGQHWDWGYYSKPPFIGWFYGLVDAFPFPKVWWFKTCATLFSAGSLYYLYKCFLLTTQNQKMAYYGLLAIAFSPANLLFSSILTIDSPLMFFWTGGMYFTAKLIFHDQRPSGRTFMALWLFLALGHLTKQMMMLQVVIILLCAIFIKRSLLKQPAFWAALLLSFLSLIPPVLWNAQNDWITFQHTGHHFESASPTLSKSLSRLAELLGALLGLVSPILFVQLFPAIGSSLRKLRHSRAVTFFFLFGAVGLLIMLGMVFRQRVNPNWPAVYLLGGLGLTLLWAFESELRQRWFRIGIKTAATLSLIMMVFLPLLEPLAEPLAKIGLKPQRRGWQGYPTLVSQVYDTLPPELDQIIFTGHRFVASHFAFHGKQNAVNNKAVKSVHLLNDSGYIQNQFDFFPAPQLDKPIAIIVEQKKASSSGHIPAGLAARLSEVSELATYPIHRAREYPRYKIYLAKSLNQWPESPAH